METERNKLLTKMFTDSANECVRKTAVPIRENVSLMVDEMSKTLHRMTEDRNFSGISAFDHCSLERKEQLENALNFEFFQTFINSDTNLASFVRNGVHMFPDIHLRDHANRNKAIQMQRAIIVVESITLVLHLIGISIREVNDDDMKRVFYKVRDELANDRNIFYEEVEQIRHNHPGNVDTILWPMIKYMFILVGNAYESEFILDILKTLFPLRIYSYVPKIIARITAFLGMLAATNEGVTLYAMVVARIIRETDGKRFVKQLIAIENINLIR